MIAFSAGLPESVPNKEYNCLPNFVMASSKFFFSAAFFAASCFLFSSADDIVVSTVPECGDGCMVVTKLKRERVSESTEKMSEEKTLTVE